MAGYSGTPLVKKLGIKPGFRVSILNPPSGFRRTLGQLPEGVEFEKTPYKPGVAPLDLILAFFTSLGEFALMQFLLKENLKPAGMLWVAWPKKASGVVTDLNENAVREIGLEVGLVDVKVCAIDEVWSGLKFVTRLKDRPRTEA